jgi:hypothetical protein
VGPLSAAEAEWRSQWPSENDDIFADGGLLNAVILRDVRDAVVLGKARRGVGGRDKFAEFVLQGEKLPNRVELVPEERVLFIAQLLNVALLLPDLSHMKPF